ncbi:hypothetical protein [Enterococcus sp. AZ109]|uniref:hypothetical protein n=1 Tax=Enterococcus sp. AZ109 TaxID=2774634 RepID=UPI003F20F722
MKKRCLLVFVSCLFLVLLGGCGARENESSSDNGGGSNNAENNNAHDEIISFIVDDVPNKDVRGTSSTVVTLFSIDPDTGARTELKKFQGKTRTAGGGDNAPDTIRISVHEKFPNGERKPFSPDYKLLASHATYFSDDQMSDANTVGFIDEEGNYTNVSGLVSDETTPFHLFAHFYKNSFWFYDRIQENWFSVPLDNISKETLKDEGHSGEEENNGFDFYALDSDGSDPFFMDLVNGLFYKDKVLKHDSYQSKKDYLNGDYKSEVEFAIDGFSNRDIEILIGKKDSGVILFKTKDDNPEYYKYDIKKDEVTELPELDLIKDDNGYHLDDYFVEWN